MDKFFKLDELQSFNREYAIFMDILDLPWGYVSTDSYRAWNLYKLYVSKRKMPCQK